MNLKDLRLSRGLTCESATNKLGLKKSTISDLESTMGTRRINFALILRIAEAYEYPISDVIYACVKKNKDKTVAQPDTYVDAGSLKELRELKGFTKAQLAKKLNINYSTLHRLEKSEIKPHSHHIYALHQIYELSCENIVNICKKQFKNFEKKYCINTDKML